MEGVVSLRWRLAGGCEPVGVVAPEGAPDSEPEGGKRGADPSGEKGVAVGRRVAFAFCFGGIVRAG